MMWMGWPGIAALTALHIEALLREHQAFIQEQILSGLYTPTFNEYVRAKSQAYEIEHPEPQAWWKTLIARFINFILRIK